MTFIQESQMGGVDHRYGEHDLLGKNIFTINAYNYPSAASPDTAPFLQEDDGIEKNALFEAMKVAEHGQVAPVSPEAQLNPEALILKNPVNFIKTTGESIAQARSYALAA